MRQAKIDAGWRGSHGSQWRDDLLRSGLCQPGQRDQGAARKAGVYDRNLYRDGNTETRLPGHSRCRTPKARPTRRSSSRLEMPGIGDELHHMGWNACSSCHDDASMERRYLILARRALEQYSHRRLPPPTRGHRGSTRSSTAPRSRRRPTSSAPAHGALPGLRHHHLVPRRRQGRGAGRGTCISTRISRSSAVGRAQWATSRSAMTSGTSRGTT